LVECIPHSLVRETAEAPTAEWPEDAVDVRFRIELG
jgi:hypothetical protein